GNQAIVEDQVLSMTVDFTDWDIYNPVDIHTITITSSNPDVSVTNLSGNPLGSMYDLAPVENWSGQTQITVTVMDNSNAVNNTDFEIFTLSVVSINDEPVIAEVSDQTTPEETPILMSVVYEDGDPDDIHTIDIVSSDPEHAAVTNLSGHTSGSTYNINPAENWYGTATITITVTDDSGAPNSADSETYTLTVENVNDRPIVSETADQVADEDQIIEVIVDFVDNDPTDTHTISILSSDPTNLVVSNLTGNVPGSTYDLVPVSNWAGTATIVLTVTDNSGAFNNDATDVFNVTIDPVNDFPAIVEVGPQFTNEETPKFMTMTFSDNDAADNHTITILSLNENVTVENLGGNPPGSTYELHPAANWNGTADIMTTVSDDGYPPLSDSETYTLTVSNDNDAPVIVEIGITQTMFEDSFKPMVVTFTDEDAEDTHIITISSDTDSVQIENQSGNSSGTTYELHPVPDWNGTGQITVQVMDNSGFFDTDTYVLTVLNVNDEPVVDDVANQSILEDSSLPMSVTFSDADIYNPIDAHTIVIETSDPNVAILNLGGIPTGSTYELVPGQNWFGSTIINVTVSDNGIPPLNAVVNYILTVESVNDAPVLSPVSSQTLDEDGILPMITEFTDMDVIDAHTITVESDTSGMTIENLSGTPPGSTYELHAAPDWTGVAHITVIIVDTGQPPLADSLTYIVTVGIVNDPPEVANTIPNQTANEDTFYAFQFAENTFIDIDEGDLLVYSATVNGHPLYNSWLDLDSSYRLFSGTPINDDVTSPGNPLLIELTATDTYGAEASLTFLLSVVNINDPPELQNELSDQVAVEDVPFIYQIPPGTFVDEDQIHGDILIFTAALTDGSPLNATWLNFDNVTRTFAGTPDNDDLGTYQIQVTVTDLADMSVSDEFDVTVQNVNNPPQLASVIPALTANEDNQFQLQIDPDTFIDIDQNDQLIYSAELSDGTPLEDSWLSFDPNMLVFTGMPLNDDVTPIDEPLWIQLTATDLSGAPGSTVFSITVFNVNDAPVVNIPIPDQNATEDIEFVYQFLLETFFDEDEIHQDSLRYEAKLADGTLLEFTWLSFDVASRSFSGFPGNADLGITRVAVTAIDISGAFVNNIFEIVVDNVDNPPEVANEIDNIEVSEDADNVLIDLTNVFTDPDNDNDAIDKEVIFNSAPGLITTEINFNTTLALSFAANGHGDAEIVIEAASNDLTVTDTFTVIVHSINDAPTVAGDVPETLAKLEAAVAASPGNRSALMLAAGLHIARG
ncbi:MAG: tandem-95 repeat protein, partial [Planctomycetes bacterium]|nr:tandem-95 repeat protein [Planctomycetota bacterium]